MLNNNTKDRPKRSTCIGYLKTKQHTSWTVARLMRRILSAQNFTSQGHFHRLLFAFFLFWCFCRDSGVPVLFQLIAAGHVDYMSRTSSHYNRCRWSDHFPITLNIRQCCMRRCYGEPYHVIPLKECLWHAVRTSVWSSIVLSKRQERSAVAPKCWSS